MSIKEAWERIADHLSQEAHDYAIGMGSRDRAEYAGRVVDAESAFEIAMEIDREYRGDDFDETSVGH